MDKMKRSAQRTAYIEEAAQANKSRKKLEDLLAQTDIQSIDPEEIRRWDLMQPVGKELKL